MADVAHGRPAERLAARALRDPEVPPRLEEICHSVVANTLVE